MKGFARFCDTTGLGCELAANRAHTRHTSRIVGRPITSARDVAILSLFAGASDRNVVLVTTEDQGE